jgi:N-methylhydantoinase A/oxoprolinase/acetone carboxylase beta subunit
VRAPVTRIGIDVGGTNTDAILLTEQGILGQVKVATTPDAMSGILAALDALLRPASREASGVDRGRIDAVMIGTTHFTNALLEARRLQPAAAIRLCLPASAALPPFAGWPEAIARAIGGTYFLCHGGHEYNGSPISPLDKHEIKRAAAAIRERGIQSIAISSIFSAVTAEFEQEAAALVAEEFPEALISLSHEVGRVGLLERENATIVNASLRRMATDIANALRQAIDSFGIPAPAYLTQNDGTLMTLEYAERYPVWTLASGPTNSMRGGAFLSDISDCAVVDIGGTTTDIGVLKNGFPREAANAASIGGIRTNFRMPDVLSVAIGGGSIVAEDGANVGPESVGFEITTRARVFGGDTLTASDLAIAAGRAEFGDKSRVADLDPDVARRGLAWIEAQIAEAIDRMKTSADPVPVVLVGGGSALLGEHLAGVSSITRPAHAAVANAIGAAIAQVGGVSDAVYSLARIPREDALAQAKQEAVDKAVAAGAEPTSVEVVDIEEVALSYLPGTAVRIKAKAVGDLAISHVAASGRLEEEDALR